MSLQTHIGRLANRLAPVALLAALLVFLQPVAAQAHAIILQSAPEVGQVVPGPDVAISLRYNSRIDFARSHLLLVMPDGTARNLSIDDGSEPGLIVSRAVGLARGDYRLRWQVLSIDGHITRGDIPFSVKGK
jgi:methionine-rich copper-binding protein CopC